MRNPVYTCHGSREGKPGFLSPTVAGLLLTGSKYCSMDEGGGLACGHGTQGFVNPPSGLYLYTISWLTYKMELAE